jgi:hypothetical protein
MSIMKSRCFETGSKRRLGFGKFFRHVAGKIDVVGVELADRRAGRPEEPRPGG